MLILRSSMIIDHIAKADLKGKSAISYYYFDYRQQDLQSPGSFLATILRQLVTQSPMFPHSLTTIYERFRHEEAKALTVELRGVLNDCIDSLDYCYIVIDALDECKDQACRKSIIEILRSLTSEKTQLFITSRPHPQEIKQAFGDALRVEITANEEDLKAYCHRMIDANENTRDLVNEQLRSQIVSTLASKARGMYVICSYICVPSRYHLSAR